jgi:hypothetical protein
MGKSRKLSFELGQAHARYDEVLLTRNQFAGVVHLFFLIETVTDSFDDLWKCYQQGFLVAETDRNADRHANE